MDRTEEFFQIFSEYNSIGSAAKVLHKSDHNYFHEAAHTIANLLDSINQMIKETCDAYVDQYGAILARKSDMSDKERTIFVEQTTSSISHAEKLINQLAENIKSGKMGLKENEIDHAIGVFKCLDLNLNSIRQSFALMRAKREQIKMKMNSIGSNPPPIKITKMPPKMTSEPKIEVNYEYQNKLEQEHDTVLRELLEFHDQILQTERISEEIAVLTRTFNELIIDQTEKIRIIKSDVEKATEDYETGTKEVKKASDSSKYQHLWMSCVILFLSFMLLFKYS
ncbi:hypothetical protein TRFO_29019 [Tritrichomonas foetus]|uniref:t-SNARE coiled-coil homology domain-containing protein n=1 Tax=Tritrichomonas foetus TaxID=1144522 RepID=A0A1J4JWR1_9EUKA|nr:hypothetical protein TRFO_29019 [Tritrichomonas foetus]|eukprot:OHT03585.1 hypothetical protein TRFO_29019 [Tritrichomonas foetus]